MNDDLTWLARNVHEMGSNLLARCGGEWIESKFVDLNYDGATWFTRDQWLARRAELQNKPSWKDAPKWAEWLAQHNTGFWCWGKGAAEQAANGIWYSPTIGRTQWTGAAGDVLGDWCDTLELRPESDEMNAAEREAAQPDDFEPLVSVEDAPVTAHSILEQAGSHMRDRAATYDKPEGERSMGATVDAFRAVTGHKLTEEQGWLFMQLLKAVRSQQGAYRADSYEDGCAYTALAGEAAARERGGAQ